MSNTPDNSSLQSRLLVVGDALKAKDISLALNLLLDIRDIGFVNKELDQHIQTLNENLHDFTTHPVIIPEIIKWIDATTELMSRTGADDFEQIEHVEPDLFDFAAEDFVSFDIDSVADTEQPSLSSSIDLDFDFGSELGAIGSDELDFDFDLAFDAPDNTPNQHLNIDQDFDWFDDLDDSASLTSSDTGSATNFDTSSISQKTAKRPPQQTPTHLPAIDNPFKNNANTPTRLHNFDLDLREPSNVLAEAASTLSKSSPSTHQNAELDALLFEEELYAQARSLAFEDSEPTEGKPLYRGEPLLVTPTTDTSGVFDVTPTHKSDMQIGHEPTNPFAHDAPTGVGQPSLSDLSDVRETNGDAILIQQVRKLYDSGKFQSALDIINNVLDQTATPDAELLKQNIERELERQHHELIGSLSRIPHVGVPLAELSHLQLDHRAGFIISQMDGLLTFEDIIDISTMSRLETMSVLADLISRGLITIR